MKMKNNTYSLIFVFDKKENVLLINRNHSPCCGLWNGIGGKKEENETIYECAKRELAEETGITGENLILCAEIPRIKSYLFYSLVDDLRESMKFVSLKSSSDSREGIISIKKISWCLSLDNKGITQEAKEAIRFILGRIREKRKVYNSKKM